MTPKETHCKTTQAVAAALQPAVDLMKGRNYFDRLHFADQLKQGQGTEHYLARSGKEIMLITTKNEFVSDDFVEVEEGIFALWVNQPRMIAGLGMAFGTDHTNLFVAALNDRHELVGAILNNIASLELDLGYVHAFELTRRKVSHALSTAASRPDRFVEAFVEVFSQQPPGITIVKNGEGLSFLMDTSIITNVANSEQMLVNAGYDITDLEQTGCVRAVSTSVYTGPIVDQELLRMAIERTSVEHGHDPEILASAVMEHVTGNKLALPAGVVDGIGGGESKPAHV